MRARQWAGWSRRNVADHLGVTQAEVKRIEDGDCPLHHWYSALEAMGLHASYEPGSGTKNWRTSKTAAVRDAVVEVIAGRKKRAEAADELGVSEDALREVIDAALVSIESLAAFGARQRTRPAQLEGVLGEAARSVDAALSLLRATSVDDARPALTHLLDELREHLREWGRREYEPPPTQKVAIDAGSPEARIETYFRERLDDTSLAIWQLRCISESPASPQEVAEKLGISRARVYQIEHELLGAFRMILDHELGALVLIRVFTHGVPQKVKKLAVSDDDVARARVRPLEEGLELEVERFNARLTPLDERIWRLVVLTDEPVRPLAEELNLTTHRVFVIAERLKRNFEKLLASSKLSDTAFDERASSRAEDEVHLVDGPTAAAQAKDGEYITLEELMIPFDGAIIVFPPPEVPPPSHRSSLAVFAETLATGHAEVAWRRLVAHRGGTLPLEELATELGVTRRRARRLALWLIEKYCGFLERRRPRTGDEDAVPTSS